MPVAGQGYTGDDISAIERFIETVVKRERQISQSVGIAGSLAKAFFDVTREIRAEGTRLKHRERSQKFNEGSD